jgi:hypothetical protein
MHVGADRFTPGWSYTIGLHETLKQPELIVVGLQNDAAHFVLNETANRLKKGLRIEEGHRERELLVDVDCEFRRIEQRWLRHAMGFAVWFDGNDEFAVFQVVYPDLANCFPWEGRFDESWRDRQPLLFSHSPVTATDEDFWAANDPVSSLHNWKFEDPPHTRIFTTKRVMSGEDPVTRVFHDAEDGAWQFHGPAESRKEDMALVCFHHVLDKDATISELANLGVGWCAWRDQPSSPWVREPQAPDESEGKDKDLGQRSEGSR